MSEPFRLPLPMWRVQYHLLGGTRRTAGVLVVCAIVLVFGFFGYRRLYYATPAAALATDALRLLGGIQGFLAIVGGCNAVYRGLLRDYDTRMIESHRLTPMSNIMVALGYLFGPTQQTLSLFALVLVYGSILSFATSLPVEPWVVGNLVLLNGAFTLWAMVAFVGLRPGKPVSPAGAIIGLSVFGWAFMLLPAAGVMLGGYAAMLGLGMAWGVMNPPSAALGALAMLHVFLTAFWVLAAADKYRRPDLPGLNGPRGLLLLAIWLAVGTVGIVVGEIGVKSLGAPADALPREDILWTITMGVALILALVPLNGAVECRVLALKGTALRGWPDRTPALAVVVIASALIIGLMLTLGLPVWRDFVHNGYVSQSTTEWMLRTWGRPWALTLVACVTALLSARGAFLIGHSVTKSAKLLVILLVAVLWVIPPLGDAVFATAFPEYNQQPELTCIFGTSPVGTIAIAWNGVKASLKPGLGVQIGLSLALTFLGHRAIRRLRARQEGGRVAAM